MGSKIVYQSLKREREEIRVLHVHAAKRPDETLRCTLQHVSLHEANFHALSYVWGPQEHNRCTISLLYKKSVSQYFKLHRESARPPTVQHITIGSNLAAALQCMRQRYGAITVWADALCINQADSVERNWQVSLMVKIYTNAISVLAWLGPRLGENAATVAQVNAAFELSNTVWALAKSVTGDRSLEEEEEWLETCFAVANNALADTDEQSTQVSRVEADLAGKMRDAILSNTTLRREMITMKALSQMEYFTRIWILQETGRARTLTFHFDQRQMSYRPLFLALSLASSLRGPHVPPILQTGLRDLDTRFLNCVTARTTCTGGKSLEDVLEAAYFAPPPAHGATDPKDLIYGRIGLAKDSSGLVVDYDLSVPQVYAVTARFLLTKGFTDPLITFKPYQHLHGPYARHLPSWAFDWSMKGLDTFNKYRASLEISPNVTFTPISNPKFPEALTMTGTSLGRIRFLGKNFSTLVLEAGLSKAAVGHASLRGESAHLSQEKQYTLFSGIHRAHNQLGTQPSAADMENLFDQSPYPLFYFWHWWLHWLLELQTLVRKSPSANSVSSTEHVTELLYREASRLQPVLSRAPATQSYGTMAVFAGLADLARWMELVCRDFRGDAATRPPPLPPRRSNGTLADVGVTEEGIGIVESFFRSAWGMRAALLDSGRLAYVPEATRPGDQVVILHGVKAPLVLRGAGPQAGVGMEIGGPAHVAGVMHGELMGAGLPTETFVLL